MPPPDSMIERYDSPPTRRTNSPLRSPMNGMWVCGSIRPGMTQPPPAERRCCSLKSGASAAGPNQAMRPSSIARAASRSMVTSRIRRPGSGPGGTTASVPMSVTSSSFALLEIRGVLMGQLPSAGHRWTATRTKRRPTAANLAKPSVSTNNAPGCYSEKEMLNTVIPSAARNLAGCLARCFASLSRTFNIS